MARGKSKKTEKITCINCDRTLVSTSANFYLNGSPFFPKTMERFPVCKQCITDYIGEKGTVGYLDRVKLVLAHLNKPLIWEEWLKRDEIWSDYIPQISSLKQYNGMTFADSDIAKYDKYEAYSNADDNENEIQSKVRENMFTIDELQELQELWGRGFTNDDYYFLNNEYLRLLNSYECDSYAMELLFQEAAQQRLTIKKRREGKESVDKELKTLQDLLGSANIKPAQETGANAVEQSTFGTLIKKYENERPIPEPDEQWKDVDGIRKYINIWFLGHLCKMLGIKNQYSYEYDKEMNKFKVEAPVFEDDLEKGDS